MQFRIYFIPIDDLETYKVISNFNCKSPTSIIINKESKSVKMNIMNYDSMPQIPPELWYSPSAILNNDWAVINIALKSTTAPMEKAMYEFLCARCINIDNPICPK